VVQESLVRTASDPEGLAGGGLVLFLGRAARGARHSGLGIRYSGWGGWLRGAGWCWGCWINRRLDRWTIRC
jgi:hypothetical protein